MTSQGISWSAPVGSPVRQAAGPSHSWSLGKEILRFDHDQSAIGDGQVPIGAAPRAGNHGKNHRSFKNAVKMCEGLRNCAVLHCSWSLFFLDSHCMIFGNPNSPAFWDGSGYISRYYEQRQPYEESLEIKRRHAFMLAGTLLNEYSHLDPGFEENCQNHQEKRGNFSDKTGSLELFPGYGLKGDQYPATSPVIGLLGYFEAVGKATRSTWWIGDLKNPKKWIHCFILFLNSEKSKTYWNSQKESREPDIV